MRLHEDMVTHRIKELREARGWSQEHLGELIGRTKASVSRLEKGETSLDIGVAKRVADAFGIPIADVIVLDDKPNGVGLADEGSRYVPPPGDPLNGYVAGHSYLLTVETDAVDKAGAARGDVLLVNDSATACRNVAPLQLVLVNFSVAPGARSLQLIRQFVPPDLLIANSSSSRAPPLDMRRDEAAITGVVEQIFKRFRRANS